VIASLRGKITGQGPGWVVIEVAGVGYSVLMPRTTAEEAGRTPGEVVLFTHMAAREDGVFLYGFLSPGELEMFRMLITVTRVGPALALGILSQISVADLAAAVIGEDEEILTRISGVGEKSARRLILELKDTMKKKAADLLPGAARGRDALRDDAESALISLGFSPREARGAVEAAIAGMRDPEVQAVVKAALQKMRER